MADYFDICYPASVSYFVNVTWAKEWTYISVFGAEASKYMLFLNSIIRDYQGLRTTTLVPLLILQINAANLFIS